MIRKIIDILKMNLFYDSEVDLTSQRQTIYYYIPDICIFTSLIWGSCQESRAGEHVP